MNENPYRVLVLPWESADDVKVIVVHESTETAWVKLLTPGEGQIDAPFPVLKEWLS